ncbi:hypothetical protein BDW22DRAFT_1324827 [Trametopsis cervina]|nr:hypothetical protein BDW22DRAFT_1324827 [Trametopsis cervina]
MPRSLAGNPPHLNALIRQDALSHATRSASEQRWAEESVFLSRSGYALRPRYQANWKPSWNLEENLDMDPSSCEDYWPSSVSDPDLMDAVDATGRAVCIKRVRTESVECQILEKFKELRDDPRNHCVELLATLSDPEHPDITYLIMPLLQRVDNPWFETVGEVVDFIGQMLEGLTFLHGHDVAHRDVDMWNVLMDAGALFPNGYHPMMPVLDPTATQRALVLPRRHARIKYFFIDFELSTLVTYPHHINKYVLGGFGRDQTVPELSFIKPYDAFKVDIYALGNLFKRNFYKEYSNFDWLLPLIESMTATVPEDRPEAVVAETFWEHLVESRPLDLSAKLTKRISRPPTLIERTVALGRRVVNWFSEFQG